jgi:hypothetical protein
MPSVPFCASGAPTLPAGLPSVSMASEGRGPAHSAANLPRVAGKEPCATCGTTLWVEAVFANNTLVCADCAAEIRRTQESPRTPPTPSQQMQMADWMAPQSRRAP